MVAICPSGVKPVKVFGGDPEWMLVIIAVGWGQKYFLIEAVHPCYYWVFYHVEVYCKIRVHESDRFFLYTSLLSRIDQNLTEGVPVSIREIRIKEEVWRKFNTKRLLVVIKSLCEIDLKNCKKKLYITSCWLAPQYCLLDVLFVPKLVAILYFTKW